MAFFISMFFCNLLIPLAILLGGLWMYKTPPRAINHLVGYRTPRAKRSPAAWAFAHSYCGRLWIKLGIALLALSIPAQLPFAHAGEDSIGLLTLVLEAVQLAVLLGSIFIVEQALKRNFDENGAPYKQTEKEKNA